MRSVPRVRSLVLFGPFSAPRARVPARERRLCESAGFVIHGRMGNITVDPSDWPLARVTYDGVVDDEAFEAYLTSQTALLERRQPYVILFDARTAGMPSARQRQRMANNMKENEPELRRLCKRGVFVISSPVVRGALTAILWLQPLPFPHDVVSTLEEAERILSATRPQLA